MNFFFFDLDGTLEDSRNDMVASAQYVRAELGLLPRSFEELVPHVNKGMRELYLNCFNDYVTQNQGHIDTLKLAETERLYLRNYENNIAVHTKLYPGIENLLRSGQKYGRIAVITNKPESLSKKLLASLGIARFVDLVVGGDTCSEAKPSPVPLKYALDTLGGNRKTDNIFMIGDSQGDAKAGEAFGVATVWCGWGYQAQAPSQPPARYAAQSPHDLFEILKISVS